MTASLEDTHIEKKNHDFLVPKCAIKWRTIVIFDKFHTEQICSDLSQSVSIAYSRNRCINMKQEDIGGHPILTKTVLKITLSGFVTVASNENCHMNMITYTTRFKPCVLRPYWVHAALYNDFSNDEAWYIRLTKPSWRWSAYAFLSSMVSCQKGPTRHAYYALKLEVAVACIFSKDKNHQSQLTPRCHSGIKFPRTLISADCRY